MKGMRREELVMARGTGDKDQNKKGKVGGKGTLVDVGRKKEEGVVRGTEIKWRFGKRGEEKRKGDCRGRGHSINNGV